jgi:hypothetical protein
MQEFTMPNFIECLANIAQKQFEIPLDILNRDLNTITSWSNKWLVSFNSQKTETMVILRKINKPHHPLLWGSHTTSPYSNSGLIKDKYNFSNDDLSSINFNIRRIFNFEYALSDEDRIWWDKIHFFKGIIQRNRINKTKK